MAVYQIHFSPTGGTRTAVQEISSVWPGVIDIDLADPREQYCTTEFTKEDVCFFAVPAYEGRVPAVALRRIQKFHGSQTPCVMVAVFGNRNINDTLLELKDTLLSLGFVPFAAVSAVAQHSIFSRFGAGRPDKEDAARLQDYGRQIQAAYNRGETTVPVEVPGKRPYIVIEATNRLALEFDEKKCTHCMQCAQMCPVGAIDAQDPGKVDMSLCIKCMRCLRICPTQARAIPAEFQEKMVARIGHLLAERKENALYL